MAEAPRFGRGLAIGITSMLSLYDICFHMFEIVFGVLKILIRRNPSVIAGFSGEMFQLQIGTDCGLFVGPYLAQTLFACLMVEGWRVFFLPELFFDPVHCRIKQHGRMPLPTSLP